MNDPIEEIAGRIRDEAGWSNEAYMGLLASLWDDEVDARHSPPMDQDGPRPKDEMIALQRQEVAIFEQLIADYQQRDVVVTVHGDEIQMTATIAGTLSTGQEIAVPMTATFGVRDARICRVQTAVDPEVVAPLIELLMAQGMGSADPPD
jgi:hypothetical protein